METPHPPEPPLRLPAAYHRIWRVVAEAGRRLGSRQALARHLHVSTHTLQRLLKRGDVPSFPETTNPRIVRAWIRTITRLAIGLGHQPRDWIESVGIPWDETTARISEAASKDHSRVARRKGAAGTPSLSVGGPAVGGAPEAWPTAITAAVVDCPPFSAPLPGRRDSFLLVLARRLIAAVQPDTRIDTSLVPEDQALLGIGLRAPVCDLSVGVVDTVERRHRGLRALAIPGLRARLTALVIADRQRPGAPPTWDELISGEKRSYGYILVLRDDVAIPYLVGLCGVSPSRLLVRSPAPPDRLAELFMQETQQRAKQPVVLVCREQTACLVMDSLRRSERFADELVVGELDGAPESCPTYSPAIAVGPSIAPSLEHLRAARDDVLFASDWRRTARLYADLAAAGALARAHVDEDDPGTPCGSRVLVGFGQATTEFKQELCNHLLATLSAEILARLEMRGMALEGQALQVRANGLAALYAGRTVPDAWQPVLDAVLGHSPEPGTVRAVPSEAGRRLAAPVVRCRSCSVSLLDEDHRGVSDRYCRFCADAQGRLKPRHEVQVLIAHWFRHWQSDLTENEAMRRADLYMQALPAWNDN